MKTEIISNPDDAALIRAAHVIRRGGIVAFPTETVYGLGASALDERAAAKIYLAKGRPSDNPLIIHLASAEDAEKYAFVSPTFEKLAEYFLPGALTVILPKRRIIPDSVTGGLATVAVRIPKHKVAHRLIELSGLPIAAPSANISGRPSCTSASHVIEDMNGRIDMIIDGGECEIGLESTIILPEGQNRVRILRPGQITVEMLREKGFEVVFDRAVTEKPRDGEKPLAPGMKYRHYSPRAKVVLLRSDADGFRAFAKKNISRENAFVCYDEYMDEGISNAFSIGPKDDLYTQAHRLFKLLRGFDAMDEIKNIYIPLPQKDDIGLALYNRLIKASGYTVITDAEADCEKQES